MAFLTYEAPPRTEAIKRRLMPHLIAYSARNEEFGRAWRARAMEHLRGGLKELLRRGIDRQIFSPLLDEELAVALLLGPMMFRHIFRGSLDKEWLARGAVEAFWRAHVRDAKGSQRSPRAVRGNESPKPRQVRSRTQSRRPLTERYRRPSLSFFPVSFHEIGVYSLAVCPGCRGL